MRKLIKEGIRWALALGVVVALLAVDSGANEAWATQVESADDEIASMQEGPTVQRQLLHRSGRVEVTPMGTFSLNDAFIRNAMPGLGLSYFLNNVFGVMGSFNFGAVQFDTSLRRNMDQALDDNALGDTSYSRIGWTLDAGLVYVPAFGKFTLLNSLTTHYDFHLFGGLGVINEVSEPAIADGSVDQQMSGVRPGGMFGAGLRFFMADSVSLNFQVRNYLMARSQEVSQGGADLQFGNTMMFSAGVGIFWPGDIQISR